MVAAPNPTGLTAGQRHPVGQSGSAGQMVRVDEPVFAPAELVTDAPVPAAARAVVAFADDGDNAGETGIAGDVVAFVGASGGVGVSVISALASSHCAGEGMDCALVDGDFEGGGLDVLLGLENDKGLRFSTLNTPLGRVDGHALVAQLPRWHGIPVLASDPWNGAKPEWWETSAALAGLASVSDLVIVDAGRGRLLSQLPDAANMGKVVVAELSVLGLIRAKSLIAHFVSASGRDDGGGVLAVVGAEPRGTSHGRGVVDVGEASSFLGREVIGPLSADARRASDILEGLGIAGINRSERPVLNRLCARLAGDGGHGSGKSGRKGGGRT